MKIKISFLKTLKRILICVRAISFVIVMLWMVFQNHYIQNYGHKIQLQDWPFSVFFCVFILSIVGLTISRWFDEAKSRADTIGIIVAFCMIFAVCYRYELIMTDTCLGTTIYADRHVYLKVYSRWFKAAEYYQYETDGILFIKGGESKTSLIALGFWDVDEYVNSLKAEYKK